MHSLCRPFLLLFTLALVLPMTPAGAHEEFRVLIFSKTAGFRHASIEEGNRALQRLAERHHFGVEATEDAAIFTPEGLADFKAVVFLNTTGNILDQEQKSAFEAFIRNGGGFVGIHSAADTEYDWEWYGQLVGAYFKSHPRTQEAVIRVENRTHPATSHLQDTWRRTDEWYNFRANPREQVNVVLSLDTSSFEGSAMGDDHPIAWYHHFDGGRAFYTGLGHTKESYAEPEFLRHLLGAIFWSAGHAPDQVRQRSQPEPAAER